MFQLPHPRTIDVPRTIVIQMIAMQVIAILFFQVVLGVAQESDIEFNRDIRPLLSDNCFACHGPDSGQRQAGLRLDLGADNVDELIDREIIVPGNPELSELVRRVMSDDPDEVMPPANHRKRLTDSQKQLLSRWVQQGAPFQTHWAWRPVNRPQPPNVNDKRWVINDIDRFVLSELERRQIQPSAGADRRTLLRRLYLDLIGLPPTPEQLEAFARDDSADAYEDVVDDLLDSPHFGERMAIMWLDLVRYADTVGYHGDQDVSVSPFRDYVINSFNQNLSFDQFTREQLAGDLLPSAGLWQKVASGYNRLGMMSAEGGVQPDEYLAKYAADRVRTTATVWLGITLGCAECHDHKFDPFTIEDFYSFEAFFADIRERGLYEGANRTGDWGPSIEVPDPELADLLRPIDQRLENLAQGIDPYAEGLDREQRDWEQELHARIAEWTTLKPEHVTTVNQQPTRIGDDGSVLLQGKPANEDCYVVTAQIPAGPVRAVRLEALSDPTLPKQGPGRAGNGNFVVTELIVVRGDVADQQEAVRQVWSRWPEPLASQRLELTRATATVEQTASSEKNPYKKWSASSAVDRDVHGPTWGWAVLPRIGMASELVAQLATPVVLDQPETWTFVIQQYHGNGNHTLGRFRVSITAHTDAHADPLDSLPDSIRQIIAKDASQRSDEESRSLAEFYVSIAPRYASLRDDIRKLKNQREQLVRAHTRTSLVTESVPPRPIRVLPRGNWMDPSGAIVASRIPTLFLNEPVARAPSLERRLTRLDLADWIVSPDNPLTARAFANRIWKLYFGTGLSKTLDDLGSQGEWPSHPMLLDWLASRFIDSGWDTKELVRTIVTSQTYRQSSMPRADLAAIDPYNRLLARQSRFRLDAELIRDNALAVSGLLVRRIGGRSVKPYQPDGLYRHLNFPVRKYHADQGENQFRRGVYTHWQRQYLHPMLKAFDAPPREESTCERPRSNTPVGALVLLNDPSFVEAARNLAARAVAEFEGESGRVSGLMRLALGRSASPREAVVLENLYHQHLDHFLANPDQAEQLLSVGISPRSDRASPAELAAWTSVARTILNLHEFITRF